MRPPIANYGDVDYIEHGGFFVFDNPPDRPAIEILEEPCDDGPEEWTVYRFDMEPHSYLSGGDCESPEACGGECRRALARGPVLSDNRFHAGYAEPNRLHYAPTAC